MNLWLKYSTINDIGVPNKHVSGNRLCLNASDGLIMMVFILDIFRIIFKSDILGGGNTLL